MILDIVMPFYGRADHFMQAVQSVLGQDNPAWRLVILDDQNPDPAPGAWAAALDDPRISHRRNEVNLGVSGNFARAAEVMTAEFGVIMGCDDILLPGYVGRMLDLVLQHPDVDMVQPGVTVIDGDGNPVDPLADRVKALYRGRRAGTRVLGGEELATSLLRGNWAYFPSVAWRASLVRHRGFRADLAVVQDLRLMLDIVEGGGTMLVDDSVVFAYRRHRASVSAVGGPDGSKFLEEAALFAAVAAEADALGWPRAARAARSHLSSRLHALADLPAALRARNRRAVRIILGHALGRS